MRELPEKFIEMLNENPIFEGLAQTLASTEPEVSVRVNPLKGVKVPAGADMVPWCENGYYLKERPQFTFDPALHQGLYYVQDASSMIIESVASELTTDGEPVRWLDACAAPGGKTTAIASALPENSLLVANEFDFKRASALVENIERWGSPNIVVTRGDTARFKKLPDFFDIISVDAPCSGEGMMRKEEIAVSQWSPSLVDQCAALQREILANVWPSLKPGGILIYSTCTFNPIEDEGNMQFLIDEFDAETVIEGRHFIPGQIRGEGLYICAVRKPGSGVHASVSTKDMKGLKPIKGPSEWLTGKFVFQENAKSGEITAWPEKNAPEIARLRTALDVLRSGVTVGTVKGKNMIPSHALALSTALNDSSFNTIETDYQSAISFLKGEPLHLPEDTPKGIVLVKYGGHALGFVKNLGNRANNLLPDNRRIRSANVPDTPPCIL